MKNIIIGGSCRAGKSMLAKRLLKEYPSLNYIATDHIRTALIYAQPYKNFDNEDFDEYRKFVYKLFERNKQYNKIGMFLMFEGGHFSIDEFLSLYTSEDTIGIFVGKPNLSEQEYFDEIRAHEGEHNWTKRHSDEKLKEFVKSYHKKNLEEAEQVKKLNLDNLFYLDTSFNQLEKIDAFIEAIKPILDA